MFYLGVALSLVIGISLGLLGGGGSILTVPILLYVFGVEPHQAIAMSLFVVGSTSLIGAAQHARMGHIQWRIGGIFAIASMGGAYGGARLGAMLPGAILLSLFALMMVVTAVAMLRKREDPNPEAGGQRAVAWIMVDGLLVGAFTGMVGAGGGFLVVPALAILGGLPIRHAIGTSLMVIALKSFSGLAGYLNSVTIPWEIAWTVTAAAIAGTFIGTRLAGRWSPRVLRRGFAFFVLAMGIYILVREAL